MTLTFFMEESMSEDTFGTLVRSLAKVPDEYLSTIAELVEPLQERNGKAWHAHLKTICKDGLPLMRGKFLLMRSSNSFKYPPMEQFDPASFLGELLYEGQECVRVLGFAKALEQLDELKGAYFDLLSAAADKEIALALPQDARRHFNASEWLARIASLIRKQPLQIAGDLLMDGSWNVFYVQGYVSGLRWDEGKRRWVIQIWRMDERPWESGTRIFVAGHA